MNLGELAAAGDGLGLKFNKSHTKADRSKRILLKQTELAVTATPQVPISQTTTSPPANSPSPNFDRLTEGDDPPPDNRGGKREGAGRKVGSTEERAAMRHLSEVAHPPVKRAFEALFQFWADMSGCPDVALTDAEAEDLALGPTNGLEYTGLIRYIPAWLEILVDGVAVCYLTIKRKAQIARAHHKTVDAEVIAAGDAAHE